LNLPTDLKFPHPDHPNFCHLKNLLDLFYIFLPIIRIYKAELRHPSISKTISNFYKLLYLFASCPSPSYISAIFLQLQQYEVWKSLYPTFWESVQHNSILFNEDMGEISLSTLSENSPTVLQNVDLLSKSYLASGYYRCTLDSTELLFQKVPEKPMSIVRLALKAKATTFILTHLLSLHSSQPFPHYSALPAKVYKLNPQQTKPNLTSPFPIILKTPEQTQLILQRYAARTHKLLSPKQPKQQKQKRKRDASTIMVESSSEEEDEWENEKSDEDDIDHDIIAILSYKKKTVRGESRDFFEVEFSPPEKDGTCIRWVEHSELIDKEALIEAFFQEL
jgi:hypothetical protein